MSGISFQQVFHVLSLEPSKVGWQLKRTLVKNWWKWKQSKNWVLIWITRFLYWRNYPVFPVLVQNRVPSLIHIWLILTLWLSSQNHRWKIGITSPWKWHFRTYYRYSKVREEWHLSSAILSHPYKLWTGWWRASSIQPWRIYWGVFLKFSLQTKILKLAVHNPD